MIDPELRRVCDEVVAQLGLYGATVTVMAATLADPPGVVPSPGEDVEALAAASDDLSRAMAERQSDLDEGPSREAFDSGRLVLVDDLSVPDGKWPAWTPLALSADVRGVVALPLSVGAARLGVFTCYLGTDNLIDGPLMLRLLVAADDIIELLLSSRGDSRGQLSEWEGQRELHIRAEVYQAQGMLMVALEITMSDALARLRAMASAEGIDLNELAVELVSGRRPFPER